MGIKRKISEERKQQLRDQLEKARAKRKPAEYKNIHASVLALPDDDNYSFKNVKEWIKESKEQVAAFNKSGRGLKTSPQDKLCPVCRKRPRNQASSGVYKLK